MLCVLCHAPNTRSPHLTTGFRLTPTTSSDQCWVTSAWVTLGRGVVATSNHSLLVFPSKHKLAGRSCPWGPSHLLFPASKGTQGHTLLLPASGCQSSVLGAATGWGTSESGLRGVPYRGAGCCPGCSASNAASCSCAREGSRGWCVSMGPFHSLGRAAWSSGSWLRSKAVDGGSLFLSLLLSLSLSLCDSTAINKP